MSRAKQLIEALEPERPKILKALRQRSGETTLRELFAESKPDEHVMDDIGTMYLDNPLTIRELASEEVGNLLLHGKPVRKSASLARRSPTWSIVEGYIDNFKTNGPQGVPPILADDGEVLDGHHRSLAAFLAGTGVRYVDVADLHGD